MAGLCERIDEAVAVIQKTYDDAIDTAVVLGTGLSSLGGELKELAALAYSDIPHFPQPTVATHTGRLIFGTVGDKKVCALEGRFHVYEGCSLEEVTFPVRVMKAMGAETLILSNAAGGMNPKFKLGDLMLITDHINCMGVNPLIGPNDERLGPRFPDMFEPYSKDLIAIAVRIAEEHALSVKQGVYVGVTGPNLETPAEYKFLTIIGADAVGMSTVPEVIVGVHAGLRILGVSCITDLCYPGELEPVDIAKIIKVAGDAESKIALLITELIKKI